MAGRKILFEFAGDTSQLEGSLNRVGKGADASGNKFKKAFQKDGAGGLLAMGKQAVMAHPALAALVVVATGMGVAMLKATKATIEFAAKADVIAKKARAIGTDAESLQVLQGALEMGGVAAETTANAIQKLSVNLGMAAKGSKMQVEALDDLGLSFEELESVPLEEKIALIADGMGTMTSQSQRAQAAQALLGRGAMDMLAAFDEGGAAIRASAETVRDAGIISNETAKQSEVLTDAVTIATRQFTRFKDGALEPLIPIVTVIVTKLGEMFQSLSESGVLQATAAAVGFVAEKFLGLTDEVERFKLETEAASKVGVEQDHALRVWAQAIEEYKIQIKELSGEERSLQWAVRSRVNSGGKAVRHSKKLAAVTEKLNSATRRLANRTADVAERKEELAAAAREAAAAEKAELEAAEALIEARKKAEKEAAEAAARAVARAAARKANAEAAVGQLATWAAANRDANIALMEGVDKLEAQRGRAHAAEQARADEILGKAGLNAAKREGLKVALTARLLSIDTEYATKVAELEERLAVEREAADKAEVEDHRAKLEERQRADFAYWRAVDQQAADNKDRTSQMRQDDLDEFRAVMNAIQAVSAAVMDAIGAATQANYEEKEQAFHETSDRIEEIDALLQEELEEGAREQLESEKAMLLEQAAAEKEAALDAWAANKAVSLASAIISTALAVINALTTVPFPAGVVAAIVAGVAGAVSIAAIASEQPPQLHSGGMLPDLASAAAASDEIMIRARRGEAVLSPQGVAAAGGEGGVAALNSGGGGQGGSTVNLIRIGPRTTEAIVHDTLRVPSSNLSRAFGGVRPRVGRHDPRSRKV